ncbi:hypothetical protein [Flavobacterium sp. N2270]|uniref:hypothetical protein n=1 Tax=Flavobacterium sp. N2270 TaxID=2986831 RepID=UPI002224B454|nr:hypothetical protein [Flavobacterium sp. N2270]
MKKAMYLFLLFPFLIFSQSNSTTTSNQESVSAKQLNTNAGVKINSIQNQFSNASIVEYQNQAINTIKDFYNYINLYHSSEITNELKVEVDKSIQNLFLTNSIQLKNVFDSTEKPISLNEFLSKCKKQSVVVSVSNFNQSKTISDSFFTFQYTIQVTLNSTTTSHTLTQKVYFFPSEKQFGATKKNVWQLKLGEF